MAHKKMIFGMGFRMFFLSAALIFFQAGMIFLAINKSQSLVAALDGVAKKEMPAVEALSATRVGFEKVRQSVYEALYAEKNHDSERFKGVSGSARKELDSLGERLALFDTIQIGGKFDPLMKEFRTQLKEFTSQAGYTLAAFEAQARSGTKTDSRFDEERAKFDRQYEKMAAGFDELSVQLKAGKNGHDDQGRDIVASLVRFSAFGLTVSLIIVVFVFMWTKFSFARLTSRIGVVSSKIHELSETLRDEARKTRDATISQSAAIQESASALSEMSSMIMQTGGNAKLSKDTALGAKEKAAEGGQIMERMTQAMGSIHKANAQLQEIAKIIDDITSKTTVINDIVFKTQLLSFNASIEAARAGQHGRGFAVVAEEVGNLAELSGQAASDIEMLLNDSQRRVRETLELIQNRVVDGNRVSGQALQTFSEISKNIEDINGQVRAISDATQQQEIGVKQSSAAMKDMDNSSRATTESAEHVQATSEQLAVQSSELSHVLMSLTRLTGTRSSVVATAGFEAGGVTSALRHLIPGASLSASSGAGHQDPSLDGLISEIAAHRPSASAASSASVDVSADDPNFKKVI